MPLDEKFENFSKDHDIEYFRYMDDVRIFTKRREDARLALFLMARTLRALHLNVQTAKTRIYDESRGEISSLLIDSRVDELSDMIDRIQKEWRGRDVPTAALRYLSILTEETIQHCWSRLLDKGAPRYLRMEAAYLLSRTELDMRQLTKLNNGFDAEADSYVQVAISMLLVQRRENSQEIVRKLVFHPNEKVREVGKLFRTVKNDKAFAKKSLRHALRDEISWLIRDCMPYIHLMAHSSDDAVRKLLLNAIRVPRKRYPIGGVRTTLCNIFTRTRESLET